MKIKTFVKKDKEKGYVKTVSILLNPYNSGQSVTIETDVFNNGDNEFFYNTYIKTDCYGTHSSQIFFGPTFSPKSFLEVFEKLESHLHEEGFQ